MTSTLGLCRENQEKNNIFFDNINSVLDEIDSHEKQMKQTMKESVDCAKSNYKFKSRVNGMLVIVGVILIANAIVFFWLESTGMILSDTSDNIGITNLNYFLGGIGIVALVTTFFNNPQEKMTIALADLVQMHLICNMYTLEFHAIVGRLKEKIQNTLQGKEGGCDENDVKEANNRIYDLTSRAIQLIDNHIEKNARTSIKTNTSSVSANSEGNITSMMKEGKMEEKIPINNKRNSIVR
jgi:hypothetical protein